MITVLLLKDYNSRSYYRPRPSLEALNGFNNSIGFVRESELKVEKGGSGIFVVMPWQGSNRTKEQIAKYQKSMDGSWKMNFGIYWPPEYIFLMEDIIKYNSGSIPFEKIRTIKEYSECPTTSNS